MNISLLTNLQLLDSKTSQQFLVTGLESDPPTCNLSFYYSSLVTPYLTLVVEVSTKHFSFNKNDIAFVLYTSCPFLGVGI